MKYSEVKKFNGKIFRYNYKNAVLEFGYDIGGKVEMIDGIGLSVENWETGNDYWIERYNMELEEELAYLIETGI